MIKRSLLTLFTLLVIASGITFSQGNYENFKLAEDLLEDGNFHKALAIYQKLLNEDPNNANLNFKVGFCFLNTATEKVKSIPYLEFASKQISKEYKIGDHKEKLAPIETLFYLGKAYHVNYRFGDAENTCIDLKALLGPEQPEFVAEIDHLLTACQVARKIIKNPVEMFVTNLGKTINSVSAEHSPVISGDESILIYTSKRKENTGGRVMDDGQYFEDIYISSFDGKKYTQAQKISKNINTESHEASIGLSFDGSKLFIYKDDGNDGNIYISNRKGSEWDVPVKMPEPINSKYRETHASMSFDQNEIFFTSDRKGGYGGLDIYRVRKLPNGKWSKAQNLGFRINTQYDEEGPYLHPDGTSLFFSSQGHNNMGGFDIFISFVDENGKWSVPENIGYPINTPDDDVYYIPSVDGRRAYYASYANNSIGDYDIFKIDLSETHIRNQTVIAGIAKSATGMLLKNAIITIYDDDDEIAGIYTPDPDSKKFVFILPRGKSFTALFESSNSGDFEYGITVPNYAYDQSKRVVVFNDIITPLPGQETPARAVAEKIEPELDLNSFVDSLKLDAKTLEAKSVGTSLEESTELSSAYLLVASELYENDEYMETSAVENRDSIKNELSEELIEESDDLLSERTADIKSENTTIGSSKIQGKNNGKGTSYVLGLLFGLALVGSTIYMILRRRRS
ncbi:MAG: hypothetical protein PF517_00900 [Salinivirgaceae bacterium]|jgi:tetratricopeptide (TPR) repeat protein|nr:hypothetical protein [Salinivirgaceae bacterium]